MPAKRFLQKALRSFLPGAFFSSVAFACLASEWQQVEQGCRWHRPVESLQKVDVAYVFDGDTVKLSDGRRLRLLGINTPELARKGQAEQFFSGEAKRLATTLIDKDAWYLLPGRRARDRHGRSLGYLISARGVSLGSILVAEGAAMWVAKSPDVSHVDCMRSLEAIAREQNKGLWGSHKRQWLAAAEVSRERLGFQIIRGRVSRVDQVGAGAAAYLELDDRVVLRLSAGLLGSKEGWKGRELEVRGWLGYRQLSPQQRQKGFKPFLMEVSSLQAMDLTEGL